MIRDPAIKAQERGPDAFPARRVRYLRFVELWRPHDWELKIYLHSAHSSRVPAEFLGAAKRFVGDELLNSGRAQTSSRVGFIILAEGAISSWLMVDWWSSLHLYQRIFLAEGTPPQRFTDPPPGLVQCVYDLRITSFESEAWRVHVVESEAPDLGAYLNARLDIDL